MDFYTYKLPCNNSTVQERVRINIANLRNAMHNLEASKQMPIGMTLHWRNIFRNDVRRFASLSLRKLA